MASRSSDVLNAGEVVVNFLESAFISDVHLRLVSSSCGFRLVVLEIATVPQFWIYLGGGGGSLAATSR